MIDEAALPPARSGVDPRTAIVVGGGLLGMSIAAKLRERGCRVRIVERASELGGLASPWNIGGVTWDRHYHVTLLSDRHTRAMFDMLGLTDGIRWSSTRTGFYTGGRFYDMSGLADFLRFPPLGPIDKLRLGLTILYASRIEDGRSLERFDLSQWLRKLSGSTTFERIWRPLLRAKLGERYVEASAAFIWAIIVRLYAARRSGLGREQFGYVRGGYATVIAAFEDYLRERDVEIDLGTPVSRIARDGATVRVELADGNAYVADHVVVTLAAPLAARVIDGLDAAERERLEDKRYMGIVCASVLLDEPLGPYYINNLTDDWVPFSAVIDMSAIVDRKEFGGKALVYLPRYVSPDDPIFSEPDEAIQARFLAALARMYPGFEHRTIHGFKISRVRHVFPVTTRNYSERVPPIVTSVPGISLANSAHIVNGTLNVNETIALAERAIVAIEPELRILQ